jgi:hypothetical protein
MLVEAPDGQTGRLHQACDTRSVQPLGPDLTSRGPHDPLMSTRFVVRLITHNYWIISLILSVHNLSRGQAAHGCCLPSRLPLRGRFKGKQPRFPSHGRAHQPPPGVAVEAVPRRLIRTMEMIKAAGGGSW